MVLMTLLLAGLQPPPGSHPKARHRSAPRPRVTVSPPLMISIPTVAPAPPPAPIIRTPSPAPAVVPVLTAPLDLAMVKQPKLDKFYPKELRKAGIEDSAIVNLTIDRKGEVTACRTRSAPVNPSFAAPACALGSKLRFARAMNDYPWPLPIKIEWRAAGVALVRGVPPKAASLVPGSVTMSEEDYPLAMRRAETQGRETAAVAVGADGQAGDCVIEWANVPSDFDAASCRVLMRGRFVPAQDEFGVAVPGRVKQAIRWKLEDSDPVSARSYSEPVRARSYAITATIRVSAAGKKISCKTNLIGLAPSEEGVDACSSNASDELLKIPELAKLRGRAAVITVQSALTMDGDPVFVPLRAPGVAGDGHP
ncbi:MAG: energy transducer TonB [Sphingomonas sp.]